jgi:hypothetical protein
MKSIDTYELGKMPKPEIKQLVIDPRRIRLE